jgi:hypothetical protein
MTTTPQDTPHVTPAGLQEWQHHLEAVMRGLAHALNNRAAALSAVVELSREPDDDPAATREILQGEMDRVAELVRVVRAIGMPRSEVEALDPADLVTDLQSILHLHSDMRDRAVQIDASGAPPVRAARWMLTRALVAVAATTAPPPGERSIAVKIAADGEWLTARTNAPRSIYMAELAAAMGGGPLADGSGFRIPTLEAVRRREAR